MSIGKMIRKSAVLLSICIALPLSAEVLGSWPDGGGKMIQPYASPRKSVKFMSSKTEFTVELKADLSAKAKAQIEFKKSYTLTAGKKYRFTVEAKADQEIEINAGIIIAQAPYSSIPKSWKKFQLNQDYKTFSHEFVADKDYNVAIYAPILVVSSGNAGTKITIRKVTFEKIDDTSLPQQK